MNKWEAVGAIVVAVLGGTGGLWTWLKLREESKCAVIGYLKEIIEELKQESKETKEDFKELGEELRKMDLRLKEHEAFQIQIGVLHSRTLSFLEELDPEQHNGRLASIKAEMDSTLASMSSR